MIHATDSLLVLLDDVRKSRPPVYDADLFGQYLAAIGQVLAALPETPQRWACMVLVAQDLIQAIPGLNMLMAYATVQEAVQRAAGSLNPLTKEEPC